MKRALILSVGLVLITGFTNAASKRGDIEYATDSILVKLKEGENNAASIDVTNEVLAEVNAYIESIYSFLNMAKIAVKDQHDADSMKALVGRLQDSGMFEYVEPNYIWSAEVVSDDPSLGSLWGLHNTGQSGGTVDADIDAPEAWDISTGSATTVVAVIDTGIDYNHQDLAANIWTNPGEIAGNGIDDDGNGYVDDIHGIDAVNNDVDPMDDHSHGTHCAGTIGAVGNNSIGVVGVNWEVSIIAMKFLSASGYGDTADAIECMSYLLDLKLNRSIDVKLTSNSWGGGPFSQALLDAITACSNAGIMTICAAGNDYGSNNDVYPHYPSNYDSAGVISVASTDRYDNISYFSNIGVSTVDIAAPGSDILSTTPGNTYSTKSGTSMATPHVSGLLALIYSEYPDYTLDEAKKTLLYNGDLLSSLSGKCATQSRINAYSSLSNGKDIPTVATPTISPASGTFSEATTLTLACDTAGALIHYTMDGSEPDLSAPLYSGPFSYLGNGASVVKAKAFLSGYSPSEVATANYTFPMVTLEDALGGGLTYTTGGDANWFPQTDQTVDGSAAQSGEILHNQSSWVEATVVGPKQLSWSWSVSSESCCDRLRFYIDGAYQSDYYISGTVAWEQQVFLVPSGSHTVRWAYTKDGSVNTGSDAAWLDSIALTSPTNGFYYIDNGSDITITGYGGAGGNVDVPVLINGKPVTSIADEAFRDQTSITSLKLPDAVTRIGDRAFYNCYGLTSLSLPSNLVSIGEYAFYNCNYLGVVVLPSHLETIGDHAFDSCYSLGSVSFPAGLTSIGNSAFTRCYGLRSLSLPNGLIDIGDYAFYNCSGINSVTFPSSLTSIGSYAFNQCSSLLNVALPDSLTTLGYSAFYNCSSLRSVTLSSGLTEVEGSVFSSCRSLTTLNLPSGLTVIGRSMFNGCSALTSVTIPSTVTQIGTYAFSNCDALTNLTLSDGLTILGTQMFNDCDGLTTVTLPVSLTEIGDSVFAYCDRLSLVVMPEGLTLLGNSMFYNCDVLRNISFPSSLTTIGHSVFSNCDGFTNAKMPASVTNWGSSVYSKCGSLTRVTIESGVTRIPNAMFSDCDALTTVSIPSSVTEILGDAFSDCDQLSSISIASNVTTVGNSVFRGCDAITNVSFLSQFSEISDSMFYDCDGLRNVEIPSNITRIGSRAFSSCNNMRSLQISSSVTSIGDYAFSYCTSLSTLSFPNAITSMGYNVFYGCDALNSVTLPSGMTTIASGMFSGCSGLRTLNIPSSVTSIGSSAFSGCNNLANLSLPAGLLSIGSGAFSGCESLTSLILPNGLTEIADSLFRNCNNLNSLVLPSGVTRIGSRAFSGCSRLSNLTLPNGVSSIGSSAFSECTSFTSMVIPNGVTVLSDYTFYGCTNLSSVTLPSGLTSIGYSSFNNCSSLASIQIPNGVTTIGSYAFSGCLSLIRVVIPNGVTSLYSYVFQNCSNLEEVTLPSGLTQISSGLFYGCVKLDGVQIPSGVNSIEYSAFGECSSLTQITLPNGITSIGSYAFTDCTSLREIVIPSLVTYISYNAFYGCSELSVAYFKGDAPSLSSNVFYNVAGDFKILFAEGAAGFTYPSWNGFPTLIWARNFCDFDGDHVDDLLYQSSFTLASSGQKMDGTGSKVGDLTPLIVGDTSRQFLGLIASDSVGLKDFLVRNLDGSNTYEVWLRDANGDITGTYTFDPGSQDWRIVGAYDQNRDGYADLIWQNIVTGAVQLWYLGANGVTSSYAQLAGSLDGYHVAAVGDMDDDGYMDILWQNINNSGTSRVFAWYLDAQGRLKAGGSIKIGSVSGGWRCVGLADYSGDKIPDLVWQQMSSLRTLAWEMSAGGIRLNTIELSSGGAGQLVANWQWELSTIKAVRGDVNTDWNADLLWQNDADKSVLAWYMDGSLSVLDTVEAVASTNAAGKLVALADMNGDGINDFIWTHIEGNRQVVTLWEMNSDRTLKRSLVLGKVATPYEFRAVGDMNSDGNADILWQDINTGKVIVWHMDGYGTRMSFAALTGQIPIYQVQLVADMNGDGIDDIIWQGRTGSNHRIIIWYMNGSGRRMDGVNYTAVSNNWTLGGAADYNNDTNTDLIWLNKASGQAIGWLLDEHNARTSFQTIATGMTDFDLVHW